MSLQSHLFEIDVCKRLHKGNPESVAAHQSIQGHAATDRATILKYLRQVGLATCDEIEQALGLSHQSASARMSELKRDGQIVDTGIRKPTRSGRKAAALAVQGGVA